MLVPISTYNSFIKKPTVVTKKQLPTYQSEEKPTYQFKFVKRVINTNLLLSDSLVDKVLSSPRIKPPTSNFLILDGWVTGVSLTDFAQTLKRKTRRFHIFFFTLIDAAHVTPSFVLNKNAKEKRERERERELGSFQDLRNKNCRRCTAKVLQLNVQSETWNRQANSQFQTCSMFFHSKTPYTRFNQATRKFRRVRAFARFKNEIWCMDLSFVDKLAKKINAVKHLLVRQVMFYRTMDAKGMKTKDSKETVKFFFPKWLQKEATKKIWVDQCTDFIYTFKKFCVAEAIHVYSTRSETKATFAERAIRSLKSENTDIWRNMDTNTFTSCLS